VAVRPEQVAGGKLALAAIGALAAGSVRPALAPPLAWLAFTAPDALLIRRARRRRAAADAEVPQLLDLLAAASTAGLAGPLALRRATAALRGPLGEELRRAIEAVDLGARWREELARCAERVGSADLRRAVAVLARTERLGTPLSSASAELAGRVRAARRAAAAERARKAPVKMLFPLVLLILPAFLLLTVVPVLITTVRSIG
jgi:tight adherence protein C